jgi:hypothetical protein
MVLVVGEMRVLGGFADLVAQVLGHAVSAEGAAAGVWLIVLGAARLFRGWSRGDREGASASKSRL